MQLRQINNKEKNSNNKRNDKNYKNNYDKKELNQI